MPQQPPPPPADPTPPDKGSWVAKQAANTAVQKDARGKVTSVTSPCPFCAEPGWFQGSPPDMFAALSAAAGVTCGPRPGATPCNRTMAVGSDGVLGQIGGAPPPGYPPMSKIATTVKPPKGPKDPPPKGGNSSTKVGK